MSYLSWHSWFRYVNRSIASDEFEFFSCSALCSAVENTSWNLPLLSFTPPCKINIIWRCTILKALKTRFSAISALLSKSIVPGIRLGLHYSVCPMIVNPCTEGKLVKKPRLCQSWKKLESFSGPTPKRLRISYLLFISTMLSRMEALFQTLMPEYQAALILHTPLC